MATGPHGSSVIRNMRVPPKASGIPATCRWIGSVPKCKRTLTVSCSPENSPYSTPIPDPFPVNPPILQPPPNERSDRQLLEDIWDQLRGPGGNGWSQLGGKTVVDYLVEVGEFATYLHRQLDELRAMQSVSGLNGQSGAPAKKAAAKKAAAKKVAAKKTPAKKAAKRTAAKRTAPTRAVAKRTAATRAVAQKRGAKKTGAKRAVAKKSAAKMTAKKT